MSGALPRAFGEPGVRALMRSTPEDFQVREELGFEPSGEGEHLLLRVRKREANTDWVARELARAMGVAPAVVSYAGMKDRHAVTEQWFSVQLPGRANPDLAALGGDGYQIVEAVRHARKLKRGALKRNHFELVLRQVEGDAAALEDRLGRISGQGVPNYFGSQRFGFGGGNVAAAEAMFRGVGRKPDRHRRGLYLSAARSELFNRVLAARVLAGSWDRLLSGEVLMLAGSHSVFAADANEAELAARVSAHDLHPTGPLWGRGESLARGPALAAELGALAGCELLCAGLEQAGLAQERRALRLDVAGLRWEWLEADALRLCFALEAGAYATSVVRELLDAREPDVQPRRSST